MKVIENGILRDAKPSEIAEREAAAEAIAKPQSLDAYTAAITRHIDATARSRQYDGALSIATYVASSIPAWAAEAAAFVAWRDEVWAYVLVELAKVQAGQRAQPTIPELIAELPTIKGPEG